MLEVMGVKRDPPSAFIGELWADARDLEEKRLVEGSSGIRPEDKGRSGLPHMRE